MSTTELVILSSSPTTRCNFVFSPPRSAQVQTPLRARTTISTSPELPTLSNLLVTKDADLSHSKPSSVTQQETSRVPLADVGAQNEVVGGKLKRVRKKKEIIEDDDGDGKGKGVATGSEKSVKKEPRQGKKKPVVQDGENAEVSRYFAQGEGNGSTVSAKQPVKKARKKREAKKPTDVDDKASSKPKVVKPRKSKGSTEAKGPIGDASLLQGNSEEGQALSTDKEALLKSVETQNPQTASGHLDELEKELNYAIPRRKDWTPPKYPDALPPSNQAEYLRDGQETSGTAFNEPSIFNFLPEYRYDSTRIGSMAAEGSAIAGMEAPTKKRRLDTIQLPRSGQLEDTATKPKPQRAKKITQKKKARTITELAMAQYRVPDANEEPLTEKAPQTLEIPQIPIEASVETQPKKPTRKKRSSTLSTDAKVKKAEAKPRKKKTPKKPKKAIPEPISKLLSPKAALESLRRQDLLFGTSSQLAREESPPYIRDLQRAFAESEKGSLRGEGGDKNESCVRGTSKLLTAGRSLWDAAARNHDDELLLASSQNLPCPETDVGKDVRNEVQNPQEEERNVVEEPCNETSITSIDDGAAATLDRTDAKEILPTHFNNALPTPENSNTSALPVTPSKSHNDDHQEYQDITHSDPTEPPAINQSPTVEEKKPASKITAHSRVLLLSQSSSSSSSTSSSSKDSTGWTHIDEISDSEPDCTPSPPAPCRPSHASSRRRKGRIPSSAKVSSISPLRLTSHGSKQTTVAAASTEAPPPLNDNTTASITSTNAATTIKKASAPTSLSLSSSTSTSGITPESNTWALIAPNLFAQITATVKAPPPPPPPPPPPLPQSPSSPIPHPHSAHPADHRHQHEETEATWHEKMLMYQPIDIEALTNWLNERGLRVPVTVRATARKKRGKAVDGDAEGSKGVGKKGTEKQKGNGKGKGKGRAKVKGKKDKLAEHDDIADDDGGWDGRVGELEKQPHADGEVRVELRLLSSWMVRKWCQEFSVCCVWRDGIHGWGRR